MRALKYFDADTLYSLEDTLFGNVSELGKLTYCLINEHQKVFYLAETVNVASLLNRLRLAVMKADYNILAHFVQENAAVSQMSDWTIAIFKPKVMVGHAINRMMDFGFKQLFTADPYEVSPRESASLIYGYNSRREVAVYFTTVKDMSNTNAMVTRAKQVIASRIKQVERWKLRDTADYLVKLGQAKDHTYAGEWVFRKIPVSPIPSVEEVKHLNKQLAIQRG